MVKFYISTVISLFLILFFVSETRAQGFVPVDDIPHDISYLRESKIMPPLAKVLYGRPKKEDSEVFGNLVPYDKLWRTGANEATEVKFFKDVQFGDCEVKAGTYVLVTIPHKEEWQVILSSQTDVWGACQYDPFFNVAEITVPVKKGEELEAFTIAFKEKNDTSQMILGWDTVRVNVPLKFEKEPVLVSN
ncbi:DUF2911 domain-containing protein [Aureibaculum sp. 2210JD6-5]|uniref:DUF2911 domain-containing protein n=1 Tax=Aureibaculum sp. 2210JD6-5 TaxID=3103957 RepID=UPI002AAE0FCB|nr:DUF2911 domain-containing protein [Aureibaculum sp. 2210JD6-5]MDY7394802.1 DUF2911 domain-containing protein [Aureibaculum sp. 2210JD6-5]